MEDIMDRSFADNYLKLAALALVLLGAVLMFAPKYLMSKIGIAYSPTGAVFLQFLGASLAAHAYLNWHAPGFDMAVLRLVMRMNIIALALAVVVSVANMVVHEYTTVGMLILLMHLIFLSGFLFVLSRTPERSTT